MRAFVITGPGKSEVIEVDPPVARAGEVVVDVERAGVCGTDMEFYSGAMAYLASGDAKYPIRIGHEWCGVVSAVGEGVSPEWIGRRVTGDTMLGCGRCRLCRSGRQHTCPDRYEIGIRRGWPGALAEQLPVPVSALLPLPDAVDATLGALVEPGGTARRAVQALDQAWASFGPGDPGAGLAGSGVPELGSSGVGVSVSDSAGSGSGSDSGDPASGKPVLVMGPGTIGLLVAMFAAARGIDVHLLGADPGSLEFARSLGFEQVWTHDTLPSVPFDAIVDATNAVELPAFAIDRVEPGGRVVYIGLSGEPSLIDTRRAVLKDLTVVGVLSASGGLADTIEAYASGAVNPRPLVAETIGLDEVADVLAGHRRDTANSGRAGTDHRRTVAAGERPGAGPKILINPRG